MPKSCPPISRVCRSSHVVTQAQLDCMIPLYTPNITVDFYARKLVTWFELNTKMYCFQPDRMPLNFSQVNPRQSTNDRQNARLLISLSSFLSEGTFQAHMVISDLVQYALDHDLFRKKLQTFKLCGRQYTFKCTCPPVKQSSIHRLLH